MSRKCLFLLKIVRIFLFDRIPIFGKSRDTVRMIIDIGLCRQGKGVEWCHLYCFTAEQQLARLTDINNGLSSRAFRLWKRTRAKSINVRRVESSTVPRYRTVPLQFSANYSLSHKKMNHFLF